LAFKFATIRSAFPLKDSTSSSNLRKRATSSPSSSTEANAEYVIERLRTHASVSESHLASSLYPDLLSYLNAVTSRKGDRNSYYKPLRAG